MLENHVSPTPTSMLVLSLCSISSGSLEVTLPGWKFSSQQNSHEITQSKLKGFCHVTADNPCASAESWINKSCDKILAVSNGSEFHEAGDGFPLPDWYILQRKWGIGSQAPTE